MFSFEFRKIFEEYHKELFSHWQVSSLVEQEALLSQIIRSDLFDNFVLIDEVILLYDLVRDECVRRLVISVRSEEN